MLARALPGVVVAIGRRRDRVGRAVEGRFGRRVHVLDDGFQHLRLFRDLDVLSVSDADLQDRPLPAGRLRERSSASARADVLCLWSQAPGPPGEAPREGTVDARTFRVTRRPLGFFDAAGETRTPPARLFLLSGIASPERFWSDVAAIAPGVVGRSAYPDHHRFTAAEVRRLYDDARAVRADAIVTTSKDAVRLPRVAPELPLLVFRIAAQIEDEPRFRDHLLAALRRAA
jgi:tetraacyldisaccharide 4'-kinase